MDNIDLKYMDYLKTYSPQTLEEATQLVGELREELSRRPAVIELGVTTSTELTKLGELKAKPASSLTYWCKIIDDNGTTYELSPAQINVVEY